MVGANTSLPWGCPRDTCWWSSQSRTCSHASCTPSRATKRGCNWVSLGIAWGVWQHARSSGAQRPAFMAPLVAGETFTAYPLWYAVSSLVALVAHPPTMASARHASTAPGIGAGAATAPALGRLGRCTSIGVVQEQ